jgi:hypothetical protein
MGIHLKITVMKKYLSIATALVMMVVSSAGVLAQSYGEVHGKVFDQNGEPLPFAYVEITQGDKPVQTTADVDGKYVLKPLPLGTYTLNIKMTGYNPYQMSGIVVQPERITFIPEVRLEESVSILPVLKYETYRRPLINKDGETVNVITAKELKHMPAAKGGSIRNIVAALTSDVKPGADGQMYFRGSRGGGALYFIDGVKFRGNAPNIPGSGISSVAVYTGGIPAKYGDTTAGVVIIETKSYLEAWNEKQDRVKGTR